MDILRIHFYLGIYFLMCCMQQIEYLIFFLMYAQYPKIEVRKILPIPCAER